MTGEIKKPDWKPHNPTNTINTLNKKNRDGFKY